MVIFSSCKTAIQHCITEKTFAVARLYNDEETMSIHVHDCYEIYYSISGGKQFLIDNHVYEIRPGDIFFINQYESHYISQIDQSTHERIVVSIFPEYLKLFSTEQSDLTRCFTCRDTPFGHRIALSEDEKKRFMYYIYKCTENNKYAQDVLEQTAFAEMMVFLNRTFLSHCNQEPESPHDNSHQVINSHRAQIDMILSYINQHWAEELSIAMLADANYMSSSYLCKIFKEETGTTINRYITAKRISHAKSMLAEGHSAMETSALCGFKDYSSFLRAFTKITGVSPKKYASFSQ